MSVKKESCQGGAEKTFYASPSFASGSPNGGLLFKLIHSRPLVQFALGFTAWRKRAHIHHPQIHRLALCIRTRVDPHLAHGRCGRSQRNRSPIEDLSLRQSPQHPYQCRGLTCELLVKRECEKRGLRVLFHRHRTPFGEVDLIARDPNGRIRLIEVKSLSQQDWSTFRISYRQQRRLRNVLSYLSHCWNQPMTFDLAFVGLHDEILMVEDFLL